MSDIERVRAGWKRGELFTIVAKNNGKITATVNNKQDKFNTWGAALQWIDDETKRSHED